MAEIGGPASARRGPLPGAAGVCPRGQAGGANAALLLDSFQDTGGVERLMDYIFFQVAAINGFDQFGHYLRAGLIVNLCANYASSRPSAARPTSRAPRARAPRRPPRRPPRDAVLQRTAVALAQALGLKLPKAPEPEMPNADRDRAAADQEVAPEPAATPTPAATPAPEAPTEQERTETLLDYLLGATSEPAARGIAANPVLIGAATVLVVHRRRVPGLQREQGPAVRADLRAEAEVPSAANLVDGNEVRIGGSRVGIVDEITPSAQDDGTTIAVLDLKLERDVEPLPKDTTLIVRPRSALGLKYVELTRGTDSEGFDDGGTMPLAQATPDAGRVRRVLQHVRRGDARGQRRQPARLRRRLRRPRRVDQRGDRAFRPLLRDLVPVAQNLSDPETRLDRFFGALGDAAAIVAPVAEQQASLFVEPRHHVPRAARGRAPVHPGVDHRRRRALDTAIRTCPIQRPFLRNTEGLFRELRPGVPRCAGTRRRSPTRSRWARRTLPRTPPFNRRLARCSTSSQNFADDPQVPSGLRGLDRHVAVAQPDAGFLAPAQTVCNYLTLLFRNASCCSATATQRHLAALHHGRPAAGPEQRGRPVVRAGQRARPQDEPPAHQPVSEHGVAGPAAGVRGGQRAVRARADRDRQPARQPEAPTEGNPLMAPRAQHAQPA